MSRTLIGPAVRSADWMNLIDCERHLVTYNFEIVKVFRKLSMRYKNYSIIVSEMDLAFS